jgi:exosortase
MTTSGTNRLWQPFALAGVLCFAYWTVLVKLSSDWWDDPNYSHGLLVPFVMAFLLWDERDYFLHEEKRPLHWLGITLVAGALLALWLGVAGAELYLQRLSLLLMLVGLTVYFWGLRLLQWVAMPLFLLWLAIPVPAIIFNRVAFPLQLFASSCAVRAMQGLEIPVVRQGNIIELLPLGASNTKRLEVAEACSGVRSLMALVTLAAVLAYLSRPGRTKKSDRSTGWLNIFFSFAFWRGVFIVGCAIPIAILTNAIRVSGTGILAHYYGTRVAEGFFHSFSGWAVYLVAFGLLLAATWLFDRLARLHWKAE